ncbi:MAG: acetate--CoA ligase family protein [Alphaproteobacteria bacterium]|nr:acetate--CoA ligase family protein [Alphaproteobacteria bacterium]
MNLERLLRPRSIAVFGGKAAAEVVRQNGLIGYGGEVWPVHPSRDEMDGRRVYRGVTDLPGMPDAAFIGLNRHLTLGVLRELAAAGCGGAVAYASGFAESGEAGLQAEFRAAAGDMPVLGPNCYGFVNYLDGVLLWPDQHGGRRVARGVAVITQSGNIGVNLTMHRRALPLACLITLGNQAVVGMSAVIAALLEDPRITAIGLHIEGIDDAAACAAAAIAAQARGVPIVALKTGGSAAGAVLTASHTASLAGGDAPTQAFLRRLGVAQVGSVPALLETLTVLHVAGPLRSRDIASMSCSGGEAALVADRAEGSGLTFRPLDAASHVAVAATLPALVTVSNPLDYHTFSWANGPALTATFGAMMQAGFGMTALILDFPREDRCDGTDWAIAADAMVAAHAATGAPAAVIATLPEAMPEARALALADSGVVPLCGLDEALAALRAAAEIGEAIERPAPLASAAPVGEAHSLGEWRGKRTLAGHGLAVPEGRLVVSPAEAVLAAEALGFPVAMKTGATHILHKTEVGGVRLGLDSADAVMAAAEAMAAFGGPLIVERMVEDAVAEVIIGVARDPVVGLYLLLGSGGVLAELVGDTAVLCMPAEAEEIEDALRSLRVGRLLAGFRGKPAGDVGAAVAAVLAVQRFAIAQADALLEMEINPLMVRPDGRGAVAADVVIRMTRKRA